MPGEKCRHIHRWSEERVVLPGQMQQRQEGVECEQPGSAAPSVRKRGATAIPHATKEDHTTTVTMSQPPSTRTRQSVQIRSEDQKDRAPLSEQEMIHVVPKLIYVG